MNTNCQNCNRADCPTLTLPTITAITAESVAAIDDCCNSTVDWRARALTEAARADAAEARIAEVEAVARRLADFFDRQPSDYRLGLRHGAQRAVEGLASQIGEPKP